MKNNNDNIVNQKKASWLLGLIPPFCKEVNACVAIVISSDLDLVPSYAMVMISKTIALII